MTDGTKRLDLRAIKERLRKPVPTRVPGGDAIVNGWIGEWSRDRWDLEAMLGVAEAVAEWQRGCSNAHPGRPEECPDCTRAFSEAVRVRLASALREET